MREYHKIPIFYILKNVSLGTSRNMYKGHMDKAKVGRFEGGRRGWVGWATVG